MCDKMQNLQELPPILSKQIPFLSAYNQIKDINKAYKTCANSCILHKQHFQSNSQAECIAKCGHDMKNLQKTLKNQSMQMPLNNLKNQQMPMLNNTRQKSIKKVKFDEDEQYKTINTTYENIGRNNENFININNMNSTCSIIIICAIVIVVLIIIYLFHKKNKQNKNNVSNDSTILS